MSRLSGQLTWRSGRAYVRIQVASGKRPLFRLHHATQQEAEKRAAAVADIVTKLRKAEKDSLVDSLARRAALAKNTIELEGVRSAVRAVCNEEVAPRPQFDEGITFEQFATKWTSGELHKFYPKRVATKSTAKLDVYTLRKWVYPRIGHVPLVAITHDLCEEVIEAVPETSEHVTRQVAQVIARTLRLAVYPARLLKECPVPRGFVPPVTTARARTYLFPEEDRALLECKDVYLVKRLLYGVLTREGLRVSEALSLDISDIDLRHGAVELDKNKTNDPRRWALDPEVTRALRLWVDHFHPNPKLDAPLFVLPAKSRGAGRRIRATTSARAEELRADLRKAGCTRPQLFENNAERRHGCVHDLRATFVTISLATNKTEAWIARRTGHRSSKMINEYRRAAECHQELHMPPLDSLVEAIPELATLARKVASGSAAAE